MSHGEERRTMTAAGILEQARDTITVKRVFGEAYASDGCLVVPVAAVWGGGGGGDGADAGGSSGSGGGFGVSARPVGVYRIRGEEVAWLPAFDLTRVALLVLRSILRGRDRR
jgi:uncharacterized spore protein YtfJ